jgi:hypothetical protein
MAAAATPAPIATASGAAAGGGGDKYVVWSSAPSDAPRLGPDDR